MGMMNKIEKAIIFSAPSGSGKTTIVRALLERNLPIAFSISATSRPARGQELNGVDYYFLGINGFKEMVEKDAFVEWEEVYENQFYGTLKSEVERIWNNGNAVLFDVDVYGGLTLKENFGKQALAIFIQPPSIKELENRLIQRGTEDASKIAMRLSKAEEELEKGMHFDAVIINDDLQAAVDKAEALILGFLEHE